VAFGGEKTESVWMGLKIKIDKINLGLIENFRNFSEQFLAF
jgi:hypothetical protein